MTEVNIEEFNKAMSRFYCSFYPKMDIVMVIDSHKYYQNLNRFMCNVVEHAGIPGIVPRLNKSIDETIQSFVKDRYDRINFGMFYSVPVFDFDTSELYQDENIRTVFQKIMKLNYREYKTCF